ncbi:CvpA family protein [Pleionea sp. CnH1-48]|uniref:CvpA family protein n=1 Tax=Pleionea sp. CnH1-48 TaxID=2954494 RepID=UPI0020982B82|nr:CvpA family protein [Pleionea sp. CnH1-48]MCO7226076.1 CvpA family protein [Pleionea sp. CnH1-48]
MVWFDWVILGLIGISTLISLARGFIREAFSLAGWILAFFVAKGFYVEMSALLQHQIETPSLRMAVAWGLLFFMTLAVTGLVNYLLSQFIERSGLSGMDRMMGMAFGALRGVLMVSVIVIALKSFTPVPEDNWWKRSTLVPYFEVLSSWFYAHLKQTIPSLASNDEIQSSHS